MEVGEVEEVGEEVEESAEMRHKGVGEEGKKGGVEEEIKEVEEQM